MVAQIYDRMPVILHPATTPAGSGTSATRCTPRPHAHLADLHRGLTNPRTTTPRSLSRWTRMSGLPGAARWPGAGSLCVTTPAMSSRGNFRLGVANREIFPTPYLAISRFVPTLFEIDQARATAC
jgi:hypothetical protein